MLSQSDFIITEAARQGYCVINGEVFHGPNRVKTSATKFGHLRFTIRISKEKTRSILVHRLVGYQKFGDKIFDKSFQIRHLDSNPTNNLDENIGIGSASQNMMDKSPELRLQQSLIATSHVRKHSHSEIINMHKAGMSYKQIMEKTGIKSKGTISFIVKQSFASQKSNDILLQKGV